MNYISLFSGIEAASVAWGPLGWNPIAFSEIEPFCCELLAKRFPDVPNLGDISGVDSDRIRRECRCHHRRKPVPSVQHGRAKAWPHGRERSARCLSSSAVLEKLSPAGSSGRTSPEFCHRTKGEPLAPSSGSWKTAGTLYRGECWTLSSSEYPSDAAVCFLSGILCQDAPREYSLSPTACEGIIRRAERRGRSLPPTLKSALEAAIRSSSAIPAPRASGGGFRAFNPGRSERDAGD